MAKRGRKANTERRYYEWGIWGCGFLTIVLLYGLFVSPSGVPRLLLLQATLTERSDDVADRIEKNAQLQQQLEELRNNDQALEKAARAAGFVHPDEIILVPPTTAMP